MKKLLIGIVGKPNVGKSTFFSALTMVEVEISNRPFTTIRPNEGVGYVRVLDPGQEFGLISNPRRGYILGKYRFVPIKIMDVAGLVPGAHKGKGLGNKFLDDLRKADGLIHIIDISGSTDENGNYVGPGNYPPEKDILWLEKELDYWFYGILNRNWEKILRKSRDPRIRIEEEIANLFSGLQIKKEIVFEIIKKIGDPEGWDEEDKLEFCRILREIGKPSVICANKIDVEGSYENIKKLKKIFPEKTIIPTSAFAELILKKMAKEGKIRYIPGEGDFEVLKSLSEKERKVLEYIREKILEKYGSTGVQKTIETLVFEVLKYIPVFPVPSERLCDKEGRILPDCILLPEGSTPIDLARRIHSEMAEKFIKAFDIRRKITLGKDYKLKKGDIIQIVFGR